MGRWRPTSRFRPYWPAISSRKQYRWSCGCSTAAFLVRRQHSRSCRRPTSSLSLWCYTLSTLGVSHPRRLPRRRRAPSRHPTPAVQQKLTLRWLEPRRKGALHTLRDQASGRRHRLECVVGPGFRRFAHHPARTHAQALQPLGDPSVCRGARACSCPVSRPAHSALEHEH